MAVAVCVAAWPEYSGRGRRRAGGDGQWRRVGGAVWPVLKHRVARPGTHRRHTQEPGSVALPPHGPLDAGRPRRAHTAAEPTWPSVTSRALAFKHVLAPKPFRGSTV
jgi:hypothetical protein